MRLGSMALVATVMTAGCKKGDGSGLPFQTVGRQPDVAPVMLNKDCRSAIRRRCMRKKFKAT